MKIHEYQAKELFHHSNITVPAGRVATTPEEAVAIAEEIGYPVVVKAQILAGGRGKAGGIRVSANREEVREAAETIIGMTLKNIQTGDQGRMVSTALVEQVVEIARELYLSILPDRASAEIIIIVSTAGGMDIEEVAEKTPDLIFRISVDPMLGIQPFHLRQAAFSLGFAGDQFKEFTTLLDRLYNLVINKDLLLVEINPLVITRDKRFVALDAKVEVDSNALFRHPELAALRDPGESNFLEIRAKKYNLNYIHLNGTIGTIVNGAGLAMATMDLIKKAGAEPANFLDVGGGASREMIANGFRILLSNPDVNLILINIFGGILRCDVLAEGVVEAVHKTGLSVPVIVRMEGTNVAEGRRILEKSGLDFIVARTLKETTLKIAEIYNN